MRHIRIAVEIPAALHRDIEQGVYYCSESILGSRVDRSNGAALDLDLSDEADRDEIERTVLRWVEQTIASSLAFEDRTVSEWGDARPFRASPEDVSSSRELRPMGEGLVAYGPRLTRALRCVVDVCEQLSQAVGAEPFTLPAVATVEQLHQCDYLRQFPQQLSFVTHLREDHTVIDTFAADCREASRADACQPRSGAVHPFGRLLRPAVCYHVYPYFEGDTISTDPYLVCAHGDCFRYESRNTTGLDRLFDFRMYEVVALGTEEGIRRWREDMMSRVVEIFSGLGLPGRVKTSNDPFFVSGSVMKSTFQRAYDLKYELEVPFPNREGNLAVASFNAHQEFFGRRFDIKLADGAVANTGCTALGVDRILAALLVHHGLEIGSWPAVTRRTLGLGG
jgi:seryl-tRNA synthetase